MAEHDVLVVGGGLGGLAAAVALARAGRRVTVLERHEVVGGYATNFTRGPYRFDVSLHMLDAVEPGGSNRALWEYLGLDRRVVTRAPDDMRTERWPDRDITMGQGMEAWVDALSTAFPDQREGLDALVSYARSVYAAVLEDRNARFAGAPPPPLGPPLSDLLTRPATPVLQRFLSDPRCVAVAGSLSCYLGLGCDELAAIPFLAMLASYHDHSGSYPEGGSGAISQALADELASLGATVRTDTEVTAIHCERRAVTGVSVAGGERLDAPIVVTNTSPLVTYGHLVDDAHVERRFRGRLDRATLGTSVCKAWLGLPTDVLADDVPYEVFLRARYSTTFVDGTLDDLSVVAPHRLDPGCAPDGGGVVAITLGTEPTDDPAERDRLQDLLRGAIDRVERELIPGLRAAADVEVLATPHTFHRYTHNPAGTIHGFRPVPSQSGPRRLGVTGPIGGLFHVGGWTYAGSGFTPAMTSGLVAAAHITGRLH